jgi:hypothetical protein
LGYLNSCVLGRRTMSGKRREEEGIKEGRKKQAVLLWRWRKEGRWRKSIRRGGRKLGCSWLAYDFGSR